MGAREVFGSNVARLRARKGMSQTRLAYQIDESEEGISQSYVSQLEAGKRNPKLETIVAIARALGAPIGELVEGCDQVNEER